VLRVGSFPDATIAVGELKGIRMDKDWGDAGNQKLHAWPFNKLAEFLTYKAALASIQVVKLPEKYTSATCSVCGKRVKKVRVHRGLFVHCGKVFNADLVGAYNILTIRPRTGDVQAGLLSLCWAAAK